MIRVILAAAALAAVSLAGLYGIGLWMRATGRHELDDTEQRRWADFAAVMDHYTGGPK